MQGENITPLHEHNIYAKKAIMHLHSNIGQRWAPLRNYISATLTADNKKKCYAPMYIATVINYIDY